MAPEIPPERLLDLFTRIDDLLVLNLEATRKLTESIDRLTVAIARAPPPVAPPPAPPAVAPPPRIVAAPAPVELVPLTSRLDSMDAKLGSIDKKLGALQALVEEYRKRDLQGKPVVVVGRYTGTGTDYQTLALWRVGDLWGLAKGRIEEISVVSSDFSKTRFKLTVMGKVLFKDLQIQISLTLPLPPHEIPATEKVIIECKSSDGTNITVNGSITGKEFG